MLRHKLVILPYKRASEGARILARKLNIYRMPDPGLLRGGHHVINWGNTKWGVPVACKVFNRPEYVAVAINKLYAFQAMLEGDVSIPEITIDPAVARQWKGPVVCRTKLTGTGGEGIVFAKKGVDIVPAKLYTKYVKKSREYRVHVFEGRVIGYKRKVKVAGVEVTDTHIRSHDNGYRYIVDPQHPPSQTILDEAVKAMKALKLDFGGVDVIWTEKNDKAYVLEVNTAPGMTDMTGDWYAQAFMEKYKA